MTNVTVNFKLRPHQLQMYEARKRFEVRVVHRRFGKTYLACAELVIEALSTKLKNFQAFYICPTFRQAKAVSWQYIKDMLGGIPGTKFNESELKATTYNGASIQLLGSSDYDSLRGRYCDFCVLDEVAQIPRSAWTTVLSPMLADRKGRAMFIGTPQGRVNLFHELYDYGLTSGDAEWQSTLLTYKDTGVLDPSEVKRLRRTLSAAEFEQELMCSFNATIRGAYYGKQMGDLEREGRATSVKYDRTLPVYAALDLGYSDTMVTIHFQLSGSEIRILKADGQEETSIVDMVALWRDLPWPIEQAILPHDARQRSLADGKSRVRIFNDLGVRTRVLGASSVHDGINMVRDMLPNVWMDAKETQTLREALNTYRSNFDEVRNVHNMTPLHSWESHWADAMRYLAMGRPSGRSRNTGPRPQLTGTI